MLSSLMIQLLSAIGMISAVVPSSVGIAQPPKSASTAAIESVSAEADVLGVYRPGEPIAWTVQLNRPASNTRVNYVVRDWRGEVKQEGKDLRPSDSRLRIACNLRELGWFELTVTLQDASGRALESRVLPFTIEPKSHSEGRFFRYGVCAHTAERTDPGEVDKEIRLLGETGADITRMDVGWQSIQPRRDEWKYQDVDRVIDAITANHIEFQGIFDYTARWATTGDQNDKDPSRWSKVAPELDPYLAFVTKTVDRYKSRVRFWEIWNEPDIGIFWQSSTEKYVALFNATSKAIKEADPHARVLNGGLAMVSRQPNPDFIRDFLKSAALDSWDILAYHDYHTFPQMLSRNREHRQLYKSKGASIPTWVNEGGFHGLNPGGDREQAVTLVKKYATAPALGISGYFWYDLRDDGVNPNEPDDHYGLVNHDFSPKPALAAYQALVNQLADRKFVKQLENMPAGVFAQLYSGDRDNGDNVLVIWREGEDRSTPIWLNSPSGATAVFDMMGNLLPSRPYAAGALVNITDTPQYVHIQGPGALPQVMPILSSAERVVLTPGAPSEVSIRYLNPSSVETKIKLSFRSDSPDVTLAPAEQILTIPPWQTVTARTKASVAASASRLPRTLIAHAQTSDSEDFVEAVLPLSTVTVIPHGRKALEANSIASDDSLSITLNDRDHIHNLFSAEPTPEMEWRGEDDLSATAQVACDSSAFFFEVIAHDDVHRQVNRDAELWQGDSLQFGIRVAEAQPDYLAAVVALAADGPAQGWVQSKPFASTLKTGRMGKEIPIAVRREDGRTIYSVRIPWIALGLSSAPVDAFRFNFIVNDDDGKGRKQWVQMSPGLGDTINPDQFRLFVCR